MPPQLSVELTGDEVKLFKSLQKIVDQQTKMADGFGKVKDKADKASKTSQRGFGSNAVNQLKGYVAGVASITTAWQHAQAALQHYQDEVRSAKDQTRGLAESRRRLAQVGGGDAGRVAELNQKADAAASRFGVERDVARRVLFSAVSEGFESDFERILSFQPLVGTEAAATVAGRGPGLFRGQINPIQSINAVQAAAENSNLSFEEMAGALPIAAQGSALNKGDAVETIAALSVLAKQFESANPAATSISTFASKAALNEDTKGQGIIDALRVIQQMPEEDRRKFLGESKELNTAYTLLSQNLAEIESTMTKVSGVIDRAGTDQSFMVQGVTAALEGSPEQAALIEADKARIQKEILQEKMLATGGLTIEAKRDEIRAQQYAEGVNAYDRFIGDQAGNIAEFAGLNEGGVQAAQQFGESPTMWLDPTSRLFKLTNMIFGDDDDDKLGEINNELKRMNRPSTQSTPDADR